MLNHSFDQGMKLLPKPHPSVLYQPVADGAVLLNPEQEIYFGLNSVGAQIWQLLPPHFTDLDQVCEDLGARFPEVESTEIRGDVEELLASLLAEGLVLPADAV